MGCFAASARHHIYVAIHVKPANRLRTRYGLAPCTCEKLNPLSKLFDARKGQFFFKYAVSGTANICIRSSSASSKKPIAFALRVESSEDISEIYDATKQEANVDQHLTHMESELKCIFQLCELLMTGFTQVIHIVRFFKSRRII